MPTISHTEPPAYLHECSHEYVLQLCNQHCNNQGIVALELNAFKFTGKLKTVTAYHDGSTIEYLKRSKKKGDGFWFVKVSMPVTNETARLKLNFNFVERLKTVRPSLTHCGKVSYVDREAALKRMRHIQKFSDRSKIPTRAYQCDKCGLWHLTSIPQKY